MPPALPSALDWPLVVRKMGEFGLIDAFFKTRFAHLSASSAACARDPELFLGIGDDCALLPTVPGVQWALSTDTMVQGRHFLSTVSAAALGHKALAVNLSDLAACGAQPVAFLLSLTLPEVNEAWLDGFSSGLLALATQHRCPLVGGNTTRGPLAIGITVVGEIALEGGRSQALKRSGAKPGDDLWVSGSPGLARAALEVFRGNLQADASTFARWRKAMERPEPRVALGLALRGVASAAIDVSDGLIGDVGHVLRASGGLGLDLDEKLIAPICVALNAVNTRTDGLNDVKNTSKAALSLFLNGGDDYELAFTAAPAQRDAVLAAGRASQTAVTRIGQLSTQPGVRWHWADGSVHDAAQILAGASFDHFA